MALTSPSPRTRRSTCRRGNVLIETAFVLPILLVLAFGTVEFGYFFFVKHNIQAAAREGARRAVVESATQADVQSAVATIMQDSGLADSGYTITTAPSNIATAQPGDNITVTVSCTWGAVGISPISKIDAAKPVTITVAMRKE